LNHRAARTPQRARWCATVDRSARARKAECCESYMVAARTK